MMELIDTHCHIHSSELFSETDAEKALKAAVEAGVTKIVLIATTLEDSRTAIDFANKHAENCWASIGVHPHEATKYDKNEIDKILQELQVLASEPKVVAVGECGFDFYYNDKKEAYVRQVQLLRGQLDIAKESGLPVSFHVREAFDEFWHVFEEYKEVRGVLHSFTDRPEHAKQALEHGLFVGVNGIATFTSHKWQRELFKDISLEKIVLETDSPFLTPHPLRGTINSPKNVIYITNFMAELRGQSEEDIAKVTTANALSLFNLT